MRESPARKPRRATYPQVRRGDFQRE